MYVCEEGLKLSDKELRSFLILKVGLLDWQCYHNCKECNFEDDGSCMIKNVSDEFDVMFRGMEL